MDTGLSGGVGSWAKDHGFRAFYSGTLQQGDHESLKIPADQKPVDFPYSEIALFAQSAQTGVDVLVACYKGVTLIDTAVLEDGETEVYFPVTPGSVDAFDPVTFVVSWVGTPASLGITLTMRLQ